jgi:alkanesulfonate monooxygenase SsuD/methylene tetrahydromethanopterin reductase-like flavin-dependent oxidoreductase (luciferase family)
MDISVLLETGPDAPGLARLAESCGFGTIYLIDSQIDWREVYPYLTLCVRETSRIRVGTMVTNPVTRHPTVTASAFATLQEISGGRMVMGVAKGDSAVRRLGERQATMAEFRARTRLIQQLIRGESAEYKPEHPAREKWLAQSGGKPVSFRLTWFRPETALPVYIAGYGPKALELAGDIGDGVIVQAPATDVVRWALAHVEGGARGAGRDPGSIRVVVSGPVIVSDDLAKTRDDLRWFVQAVWNHTAHLLEHYERSKLPRSLLLGFPDGFTSDYAQHVRRGVEELRQVCDEAVDALTVFGPPKRCIEKLRDLRAAGANEFCVYALAMPRAEIESLMRALGSQIIAHV